MLPLVSTQTITPKARAEKLRARLARLARPLESELVAIMALREIRRLTIGARSGQGMSASLVVAGLACLLIPLHRVFGVAPGQGLPPYMLFYGLAVQLVLLIAGARAVWAGMRHDVASGTAEELLLTGAEPAQILLGKWLGACGAGLAWSLFLLPFTLFAAAFTGASAEAVLGLTLAWAATVCMGALIGALIALSERSAGLAFAQVMGGAQLWLMLRWVVPRMGGFGPFGVEFFRWLALLDPMTLVPAALGITHEAWWPKVLVVGIIGVVAACWLGTRDESTFWSNSGAKAPKSDYVALRPVREWFIGKGNRPVVNYDRNVLYAFEQAYGWRLRISPIAWSVLLSLFILPAIPLAILGREGHVQMVILMLAQLLAAAGISGLGMAASLAAEREQGRWTFLLSAPVREREIVLAKWRAAWMETWPLWAVAGAEGLLMALTGVFPWTAVPVTLAALPVAAAAAGGLAGAVCARTASLTAAQQRTLLLLLAPPVLVLLVRWLLPRLPGLEFVSLPHVVGGALGFGSASALSTALVALTAHAAVGVLAVGLAAWQLRRWPPL